MKAKKIFLLAILSLLFFSANAEEEKKESQFAFRMNFDGAYVENSYQESFFPGAIGFDLGWVKHPNLTLFAGMSFWSTDHSTYWYDDFYDYYWENPMLSILINGSAKFTSPSLRLKNNNKLAAFIEPGISIEPIPMALINYEKVYSNQSQWDIETKVDAPYFSWNLKAGINFTMQDFIFFDLAYTITNMDIYKVYRKMEIEGQDLSKFADRAKLMQGIRFTFGAYL